MNSEIHERIKKINAERAAKKEQRRIERKLSKAKHGCGKSKDQTENSHVIVRVAQPQQVNDTERAENNEQPQAETPVYYVRRRMPQTQPIMRALSTEAQKQVHSQLKSRPFTAKKKKQAYNPWMALLF